MGPIDEDEKTPVTQDPFVALEHRSKRTHENTVQAVTTIQLVAQHVQTLDERMSRQVGELRKQLDQYIEIDRIEHEKLNDAQQKQAGGLRTISAQYRELGGQVRTLDTTTSATLKGQNTVLSLIHDDVKAIKRVEEHRQKAAIDTDAAVRKSTSADQLVKRKINLEIVKIIGAALGSGGIVTVVLLALLGKC